MVLTPNLADIILAAVESGLALVFTAKPGKITDYNAGEQSATIELVVPGSYENERGARVTENYPPLQRVPVVHLGGGGFRTTYPVATGDTCLVVFMSQSIDRWLSTGTAGVDPRDDRKHSINDGVAIVGLRDFAHALKNVPTSTMSSGKDGGPTIEYGDSTIQVGGSDANGDIVVQDALDDFMTALNAAIVAGDTSGALTHLKTALGNLNSSTGWKARTSIAKAK